MKQIFTLDEIRRIIADCGPIMKLHSEEKYLPDHPQPFLETGLTWLEWGVVKHEFEYDKMTIEEQESTRISSPEDLIKAVAKAKADPRSSDPDFRYWIRVDDSLRPGNIDRAKSLVCIRQWQDSYVDLQFFFFYGFNGPAKFRVTYDPLVGPKFYDSVDMKEVGRHYGDLEHVTLRIARTSEPGPGWKIIAVYLSRHDQTHWVTNPSTLQSKGRHPVLYIARDSHAHYETPDKHYYKRVGTKDLGVVNVTVDLYDLTDEKGKEFDTSALGRSEIIFSNVPEHAVTNPVWWSYDKRWGQYEKLSDTYTVLDIKAYTYEEVGAGPGPISRFEHDSESFSSITSGVFALSPQIPLKVFVALGLGTNQVLYGNNLIGRWFGWENIGGSLQFQSVSTASGKNLEAFAVGLNGTLFHNYFNGKWHDWTNHGGDLRVKSVIAGAGWGDNVDAFAIGIDGTLFHTWLDRDWHPWERFGPELRLKNLAMAKRGNIEFFAVGIDGTLFHSYFEGNKWSALSNFAGFLSFQSVYTVQRENLEVFGIATDGTLYHNYFDGRWHDWENYALALRFQSFAAATGKNIELFGVATDGTLYHNYFDGRWHDWENFAGALRFKSVAAGVSQNVEVFAIGLDGTLYHNYFDGNWHDWAGPFTE